MIDHKKLAVIHIVKRELGLSDEEYRDILEMAAGVSSAKELDNAGFRRLMRYFTRSSHYRLNPHSLTLRQKLFIQHLFEELHWSPPHCRNFLMKYYHKPDIERLNKKEASKVIEALKQIKKHRQEKFHEPCP
ncbi:MAG: phage protein GemA/Gp16 family protein [Pseudomonadota bacterium]|nr:phage protein GemA/Gp16 family protein [Pseudomonadota bacterium]